MSGSRCSVCSASFTEETLEYLQGHLAVGHTRYSTMGSSRVENAQPIIVQSDLGELAVAHNGNLVNPFDVLAELRQRGRPLRGATTDSELIALLAASAAGESWPERISAIVPLLQGAFSLVMATPTQLIGLRDPLGVRPLVLGRLGDGWVIAVEFGDVPRAYSVLAYGQSRRPESPYHADQAEMFAKGERKTVAFTAKDVEAGAIARYRPGDFSTQRR